MSIGIQAAEHTVRLAVRASGEIKRVGQPSIAAVANFEGPQPVDDDRLPMWVAHLVKKLAAIKIEGVDSTPSARRTAVAGASASRLMSGYGTEQPVVLAVDPVGEVQDIDRKSVV